MMADCVKKKVYSIENGQTHFLIDELIYFPISVSCVKVYFLLDLRCAPFYCCDTQNGCQNFLIIYY